jgi:hypothetical protein
MLAAVLTVGGCLDVAEWRAPRRLYSPKPEVAQGSWQPPPIERVD